MLDNWENIECNICKSKNYITLYKSTYEPKLVEKQFSQYSVYANIVKCNKCGLIYESPREKIDVLNRRLKAESYPIKESAVQERMYSFKSYLTSMKRNIPVQGRLLDIGCNIGDFLYLIRKEEGLEVYGIEPSSSAADKAKEMFGLEVINDIVDNGISIFPDNFFDIATMWDVIEHLSDPYNTLTKISKKIKKEGYICITTHNIDSLFSKMTKSYYPHLMYQHFYHFSDKTLKSILNKAGYEIMKIEVFNKMWSVRYLILLLKEFFPKNKFICYISDTLDDILIFLRIQKIMLTIPLYNDIRIYARKKV